MGKGKQKEPKLHTGCPAVVERLRGQFINGSIFLLEQGQSDDIHWKSYPVGQDVGLKCGQQQRVPWLDVL